jgi:hypothetical protein
MTICLLFAQTHGLWGQSAPTFTELVYPSAEVGLNFTPWYITVADFNHDGIPDVAVVNLYASSFGSPDLAIFLGHGDGSLQPPLLMYNIAQQANVTWIYAILAGDFNGDGKIDLLLAGEDSNFLGKLVFLAGNGDGTFQAPIVSSLGSSSLEDVENIATADFTGDGKLDVVVSINLFTVQTGVGAAKILFAKGNGDGTFAAPVVLSETDGGGPIAAADLNHDGKPDIAWIGNKLNVAFGDGNGGFSAPTQYPLSKPVSDAGFLAIADFNGDGVPDILTDSIDSYPTSTSINVYPGNGNGTFGTAINTSIIGTAIGISIADFEGNGHLDLFIGGTNSGSSAPSLYLHGNGDGSFTVTTLNVEFGTVTPFPSPSVAADLNGDGKPDIVFVDPNLGVGVLLNTPGDAPIALYPAGYSFGYQTVGAVATAENFTIGNTGANPFTISSPALDNTTDYSMTTNCGGPIPAQGSCTGSVTFQPQSTGTKTANVSISGANISPVGSVIRITGEAIDPVVSTTPVALAFSYQQVGTTSASQTVQVKNSGIGPLNISSIQANGDFLQTNNCPATLAQGASCTVTVVYAPEVPGSEVGRLIFNTNAVPAQSAEPLTGIGYVIGPILAISPLVLNFGSQYVGTSSAPGVVTVQNNGDAPFSISSVTAAAGFTPLSTCGNVVQPAFSCAIGVFFDPATTGDQSGILTVVTNLPTVTPPVALAGTGTSISVTPSSSSSTSATVAAGQSATYSMSITPQSGYTGTVNLSCAGLAPGFTCSLSQNSVTLNGPAPATVTVTVNSPESSPVSRKQGASDGSGLLVLASPLAFFFLCGDMRSQWTRRLLTFGALLVAAGLTLSCGGSGGGQKTTTTGQTYAFFLVSQPATGITIDTPLTLTVETTQ